MSNSTSVFLSVRDVIMYRCEHFTVFPGTEQVRRPYGIRFSPEIREQTTRKYYFSMPFKKSTIPALSRVPSSFHGKLQEIAYTNVLRFIKGKMIACERVGKYLLIFISYAPILYQKNSWRIPVLSIRKQFFLLIHLLTMYVCRYIHAFICVVS